MLSTPFFESSDTVCFKKIFNQRVRKSFISGEEILFYSAMNYHHVLTKQAYPSFRHYYRNIIILTGKEHLYVHSLSKEALIGKNPRWKFYFLLHDRLKREYYQVELRDQSNPVVVDYRLLFDMERKTP